MKRSQGFEAPTVVDNDLQSIRRVVTQLTEYINSLLVRLDSGIIVGDLEVTGSITPAGGDVITGAAGGGAILLATTYDENATGGILIGAQYDESA
jgi:hypothetical protein